MHCWRCWSNKTSFGIRFQVTLFWMSLDGLFYFLDDFAVELALPLGVESLGFICDSCLDSPPLFKFEVYQPKLVLEQVDVLGLYYLGDFLLAYATFKIRQITL